MTDPFAVQITGREIYDRLLLVHADVRTMAAATATIKANVDDHEERLRTVERSRWPLPSVALLVAVAALVVPFLVK